MDWTTFDHAPCTRPHGSDVSVILNSTTDTTAQSAFP